MAEELTANPLSVASRWLLAGVGVLLVGVGALGVFVPGLPTTIFLIGASWCFARSIPWLERKLLRHRLFAPYMRFVDGSAPLPRRARVGAIAAMWVCVSVSVVLLLWTGEAGPVVAAVVVVLAVVGTVFIWRWRRDPQVQRTRADDADAATSAGASDVAP